MNFKKIDNSDYDDFCNTDVQIRKMGFLFGR